MSRRSFKGNSVASSLAVAMGASDVSCSVTDASSFPLGTNPFVITVDTGLAGEEKILVGARSSNALSSLTRGYDGTVAAAHAAGATVRHTLSAIDLDEANAHVNSSSAVHGLLGSIVGTSDTQTLSNKTLTAPVILS